MRLCRQEKYDEHYGKFYKEVLLTRDSAKFRMVDCINEAGNNPLTVKKCLTKHVAEIKADNVALVDYFKANYAKYC